MRRKLNGRIWENMFSGDLLFTMPPIETDRLILRRLEMRDAQDIFDYGRDPEVARHVLWEAYEAVSECRGSMMPSVELLPFESSLEALAAVIAYSFETLHLNRVEAQHELTNPASGAVMAKCGMRREGVLRQRLRNTGHYVDVALYAILRSDYLARSRRGPRQI